MSGRYLRRANGKLAIVLRPDEVPVVEPCRWCGGNALQCRGSDLGGAAAEWCCERCRTYGHDTEETA